ncbi:hypothetical protein [Paenibacillus herberti]|uniref:Uncharacterized protein n=1 Tax=Paenibacillus herberti TaxID=1619309 RepID=A0A229P545_9BACL|nr:hypothetical protein [Paenibacillus herberti]OXM17035.1 hypothetical protein CGZ75_10515 [Paenibacillus herberti]
MKAVGVILVLFILLVIVTKTFSFGQLEDDPSSILVTRLFDVVNNSSSTLVVRSITGRAPEPTPSRTLNPFDGLNQYRMQAPSSGGNSTYRGTVTYDVLRADGTNAGYFRFTLRIFKGGNGGISESFTDISTDTALSWSVYSEVAYKRLTIS